MKIEKLYTCKGIAAYVGLCDDGRYHTLTDTGRILGPLSADYIPRRLDGRGVEDITDTPPGRILLATWETGGGYAK